MCTCIVLQVNDFRHVRGILFEVSHQLQLVSCSAILLDQGSAHLVGSDASLVCASSFLLISRPSFYLASSHGLYS